MTRNHLQEFQEMTPVKDWGVVFNVINRHYSLQLIGRNFHKGAAEFVKKVALERTQEYFARSVKSHFA